MLCPLFNHTVTKIKETVGSYTFGWGRGGPGQEGAEMGRGPGLAGAHGGADLRPAPRAPDQNLRPAPRAPVRPGPKPGPGHTASRILSSPHQTFELRGEYIPVKLSLNKFSAAVSMNSELKQRKLHMLK
jgi:hypothetical protein